MQLNLAPLVREISWSNNIAIIENSVLQKIKEFVSMELKIEEFKTEYTLKRPNVPIWEATYQPSNSLPENMKEMLLEPDEILRRLKIFERAINANGAA